MNELKIDLPKITKKELLEAISKGVERAFPEGLKNIKKSNVELTIFDGIRDGVEEAFPHSGDIYDAIRYGIRDAITAQGESE